MKYYFFSNFIFVIAIVIIFIAAWFIRQIFTEKNTSKDNPIIAKDIKS
jgi:type IV secretory pathway VirB2 component (pilin)